jgi:hypothetical protein
MLRARLLPPLLAAGALALAACGGSGSSTATTERLTGFAAQSPQAILAATCAATLPLHRVAVDSTFASPAKVGGLSTMHWTMSTGADAGTLRYVIAGRRVTVELSVRPYVTDVRAPAAWWATTTAASRASTLADRWIAIPAGSAGQPIVAPLLAYSNLSAMLDDCTRPERTPTKGALAAVGQDQTIQVAVNGGFVLETFFVSTMTTPYPLKVTMLGVWGLETSLLGSFGTASVPPPPAATTPF